MGTKKGNFGGQMTKITEYIKAVCVCERECVSVCVCVCVPSPVQLFVTLPEEVAKGVTAVHLN